MKNFIQDGRNIDVTATAAANGGDYVAYGGIRGVAAETVAVNETLTIVTEGVFELPKEATVTTFAVGDQVEWDSGNSRIAALAAGTKIGVVTKAAAATDAVARVKLQPDI